jgi:hypothetical protein
MVDEPTLKQVYLIVNRVVTVIRHSNNVQYASVTKDDITVRPFQGATLGIRSHATSTLGSESPKAGPWPDHEHSGSSSLQYRCIHVHKFIYVYNVLLYIYSMCVCVCTYFLHGAESFLEKLKGSQLVKKFPAFYGTRRFITALTSACHLSLSWARTIESIPQILLLHIHFNIIVTYSLYIYIYYVCISIKSAFVTTTNSTLIT